MHCRNEEGKLETSAPVGEHVFIEHGEGNGDGVPVGKDIDGDRNREIDTDMKK